MYQRCTCALYTPDAPLTTPHNARSTCLNRAVDFKDLCSHCTIGTGLVRPTCGQNSYVGCTSRKSMARHVSSSVHGTHEISMKLRPLRQLTVQKMFLTQRAYVLGSRTTNCKRGLSLRQALNSHCLYRYLMHRSKVRSTVAAAFQNNLPKGNKLHRILYKYVYVMQIPLPFVVGGNKLKWAQISCQCFC